MRLLRSLSRGHRLLWWRGLCRLPSGCLPGLRLLATKHATDSLADTPDRLTDALANATNCLTDALANATHRLAKALTETANCLAKPVG